MPWIVLAQVTTSPSPTAPQNPLGSLLVFGPLILIFYFMMIRPRKMQLRKHQELMGALGIGDEIETVAGMYGRITRLDEATVWVEFAPGTTVKMSRAAVRRKVEPEPEAIE